MSKRRFFGTLIDSISVQANDRVPSYKVLLWNPHRTTIHDVVLGEATSPAYDVTQFVQLINYNENIVFENNDDAVATHAILQVIYISNPEDGEIEMTERTWLDGAPVRIIQGDAKVPENQWVPIFTGVVRGVPTTTEYSRSGTKPKQLIVNCVDRSEKYLNKRVTARHYDKGEDMGRAAVETAVEWMGLDRREIKIGHQDLPIGHVQSQLVDIEVLPGIAQILFTVGKKPRFDAEGFFVAADTDLEKPPSRNFPDLDNVIEIAREQVLTSVYNSVRLLGVDDELTTIIESVKRLAHGSITAGYFEQKVKERIYFSENEGKLKQGRRAKDTFLGKDDIGTIGDLFGEGLEWKPELETDGFTTFSGVLEFETGADVGVRIAMVGTWFVLKSLAAFFNADPLTLSIGAGFEFAAAGALLTIMLSMSEIGRVSWEVHGKPFVNVYQQLAATAALTGLLTEDIKEVEFRNDWLYDTEDLRTRSKELLKRELIKSWSYRITMIDDPLIETDDVIQFDTGDDDPINPGSTLKLKFYISSIKKRLSRAPNEAGKMVMTAWRLQ